MFFFFFFFFFQAEDGIRDHCVTGVQTCALPISLRRPALLKGARGFFKPKARVGTFGAGRPTGGPDSAGPPAMREAAPKTAVLRAIEPGEKIGRAACRERG